MDRILLSDISHSFRFNPNEDPSNWPPEEFAKVFINGDSGTRVLALYSIYKMPTDYQAEVLDFLDNPASFEEYVARKNSSMLDEGDMPF
ncbi:MAG: hypothetical protein ABIB79_00900 [archaeon]